MPSRRPHKHLCKVCYKNFRSGKALGGHMSRHRHAGKQPKSTPSPPPIVVDLPVLLLGPSDEKPSPSSWESQCLHCSKVFSSCQSPRGNMGMLSEKKVMAKPDEEPEPAGLMEAWANANGDHGHNVMLFSPVKRKRSKRSIPVLNSEMNAAAALLMLAEHSDKTSAYEDCCGGDKDVNISTPIVLKQVNLNAFEQLDQSDEFTNSARLKSDKNPAYEGFYEHCEKENSLNLAADAPKKEALLNLFDCEMDVEAESMKPGAAISVEELKSSSNLFADAPKKEVLPNVFDHGMSVDAEFMKTGTDISVEELKSSLNLVADAPKKEVMNVFDHGMGVDAEFMKPGADISVEELKSNDLSAAMNNKRHQCKVCGKILRSGQALGGHMTLHLHFEKKKKLSLVADVPKEEVLLDVFDYEMDVDADFMKRGADISVKELKSSLDLVADAPKKEVLLGVFDQGMDVDAEFMKPEADISVEELKSSDLSSAMNSKRHQCKVCGKILRSGQALGGHMTLHLHSEKKNKLNSVADVPKEILLNAFDNEVNADVEFMTPGAAISVDLESSDISAAVNVKEHQCKVCGKSLGSGRALGGHMRSHYAQKCNLHQDVADCPGSAMMEEQMQKLELDSPIFYRWRPHSHGGKSDSEP